jgi:DNA-binding NarL/FixJ family response regulator
MNEENRIIALSADLIFGARIRAAADAQNVSVMLARNVEDFLTKLREHKPRLAILDLDRRGLNVAETVRAVKQENVQLLCYVSHVQESAIAEAKAAGADRVMARGAFAKNLEEILGNA